MLPPMISTAESLSVTSDTWSTFGPHLTCRPFVWHGSLVAMTQDRTETSSPAGVVFLERQEHLATVRLGTGSLTKQLKEELLSVLRDLAGNREVRCVVLTGTDKVFCLGQDLKEHAEALETGPEQAFATLEEHYMPLVGVITGMEKPVLAAINGTCAGAGLSLALACDMRIAASSARFLTAFTGIGLSFDSGLSLTLARAVGAARASELIIGNQPFDAEQALAWGLVGKVVPDDELLAATRELGSRLAVGPTRAYAAAKKALASAWGLSLEQAMKAESAAQRQLGATKDHALAVKAFLQKSAPSFTGWD